MSTMNITFKHPDEIIDFLNSVCKFDFNMDMRRGRAVVDAKSLLGIMNLGLKNSWANWDWNLNLFIPLISGGKRCMYPLDNWCSRKRVGSTIKSTLAILSCCLSRAITFV